MAPPEPATAARLAPPVSLPDSWWRQGLRRLGLWLWRLGGGAASDDQGEADLLALQRSERHLRLAEQLANLGSFDWNLRTGERHWSDQHYTIWGLGKGVALPSFELFLSRIHPDDVDEVRAWQQRALDERRAVRQRYRVVHPDGDVRYILGHSELHLDADGQPWRMLGTVQDITDQHRADMLVRRHAFIANAITDPVSVIDGDRVYHLVNDAWCQDTGVAREAIVGQPPGPFQALVRSDERDSALHACVHLGVRQSVMRHIVLPGGGERWMETVMFPYDEPQGIGRAAVLVTRDVSDAQRSQRALSVSVDNLRLTLNATREGIFASDTLDDQDRLLFTNQRLRDIWQVPETGDDVLTSGQLLACMRALFVDPEREVARMRSLQALGAAAQDRLTLNDGRVLVRQFAPTLAAGRAVRVWSFRDVTLEDRALQALRESDARQRALLDAFPGYLLRASAELRYTYVNQRLAALSGREPLDIVGRTVAEMVVTPGRLDITLQRFERALAGESVVYEHHFANPAGGPGRDVLMTMEPGRDPATGERVVFGFGVDISRQKQTEVALIKARDDAEQANRAKSAFLSSMSHELRTPMNAVLGFAQLLGGDASLGPRQQRHIGQILQGGRHLLSLINDLLDLARIESGKVEVDLQPVPLRALVADCLALVAQEALQRAITLELAAGLPDLQVQANPRRLQQVLLNLLGNALKYNHEGGWVRLDWAVDGGTVLCQVHDNGPGIDEALQGRLFRVFERLDAERTQVQGSGIGLALCRRLLTAMKGEIGVHSALGSGSTFWFTLPLAHGDMARSALAVPAAATLAPLMPLSIEPVARPRYRVLCIEDNPVNLMVLECMLESCPGLDVECSVSPEAGLARALAEPPDLVLLDIQMPVLNGYQVLERLRAHPATRHVPVIAVSADAMPQSLARGRAAGFNDYLTKPLEYPLLRAALR
ncbi:MAG: hypothetical protein CFE45_42165, partial [Burkholderiales bacterium PBB5]